MGHCDGGYKYGPRPGKYLCLWVVYRRLCLIEHAGIVRQISAEREP